MDVNNFRSLYINENNLYIENDYDNITIFDPNKVVASDGAIQDRFVQQENLVFYANLETKIIPRTKLAIGDDFDNPINNTTIASLGETDINGSVPLNFLKPQNKNYFDTSWSDEYTGLNSVNNKGINQTLETKNGENAFKRKVLNYEDTQTLGIKDIKVKVSSIGVPTVDINLIDARGRALFEQGDNSIYSVFFNLPYPTFYLTLKGYYGKAVRYQLTLLSFNAKFSPETGNFDISLKLMGRNSAILADSLIAYGKHLPKMFVNGQTVDTKVSTSNNNGNDKQPINIVNDSEGLNKLKNVYKIYKQKKLIANDFPEITMEEFVYRANKYEQAVKEKVGEVNKDVINDINSYQKTLNEIKKLVFTDSLDSFLDTSEKLIQNNDNEVYYPYLESVKEVDRDLRETNLRSELDVKIATLKANATFGENGIFKVYDPITSTVDNPKFIDQPTNIIVNLSIDDIIKTVDLNNLTNENFQKTFESNYGRQPTDLELEKYIAEFRLLNPNFGKVFIDANGNIVKDLPKYYGFGQILDVTTFSSNSFLDKLDKINSQLNVYRKQIEQSITTQLENLLVDTKFGLGFLPTIRNVFAVLFAGLDAFYRLMDDYHQNAYDVKNNPERRKYILKNENTGTEAKDQISGTNQIQTDNSIYPWPQYYVKERQEDGSELYTIKYIGDQSSEIVKNGSYNPKVWPEIEFTEEFIRATLQKETPTIALGFTNPDLVTNLMPVGAIEFPFDPQPYIGSEGLDFLYQIYDRSYVSSHYSNFNRGNYKTFQIDKIISNIDAENIKTTIIENKNKVLTTILKYYTKNTTSFIDYLKATSNNETLDKWQNLINGIYNDDYIKNEIINQDEIYSIDTVLGGSLKIAGGIPLIDKIKNFLNDSSTNNEYILDSGLFNLDWLKNNLNDGNNIISTNDFYNTTTFKFLDNKKTISRGVDSDDKTKLFLYYNWNNSLPTDPFNIKTRTDLKNYYYDRAYTEKKYLTEGSLPYTTYSGNVGTIQSTSILNTPYFYNAIEDGVEKSKNNIENPYVALGYLYLNSLPIITTKETLLKVSGATEEISDYLAATLTKYGAIHKVPYAFVLKYGSIWYRYKKYIEEKIDILDDVWKDFDYKKAYDPINQQTTTQYSGTNFNIILQSSVVLSGVTTDFMNVGFYPKVVNTIYKYFNNNPLSEFNTNYTEFFDKANEEGINIYNSYLSKLYPTGFTTTNLNRQFQLQNYTTYFENLLSDQNNYLLIPSMGAVSFNQAEFECINNSDKLTIEMFNNNALFNGSVRSLWVVPQFGYFDNSQLVKPKYNEYLRSIIPGLSIETFQLGNINQKYSSIEEIFAVFSPEMLDKFEEKFLSFCNNNFSSNDLIIKGENTQANNTKGSIKNIQQKTLFSQIEKIFKVPKTSVQLTPGNPVQNGINLANAQINNFYSSLREFLNFDCIIKLGNPSGFNRYNIKQFRDKKWTGSYNDGVRLPGDGKLPAQTLLNSESSAPNEWKTLKKYVGEFEYSKLKYNNSGSPITNFFIVNDIKFSEENIKNFYPIIKLYYKEKLKKPTLTRTEFETSLTNIVNNLSGFNTDILNETFRYLGEYLTEPETPDTKVNSQISGNVTKLEYYSVLKTLNDKWVAGSNFKERTLFEDFLFFDKANRDIGDKFTIPIKEMEQILNDENKNYLALVSRILEKNNFLFFAMPSYINFYGRQQAGEGQGSIEPNLPASLFGTFLDVDYIDSRPKFLCVYVGKTSEYVSSDASYVRFKSDTFDLRKDDTLRAGYNEKTDLSKVNKVVGFNVDYGIQNQSVFKSISIDMSEKKNTAESLKLTTDLGKSASADKVAQQSVSLYSIYKTRSYVCSVQTMGNATIQPTMYFNLRHVPLFYGPYWINEVNHTVSSGKFETDFKGIRMSLYNLPSPDSLLTSANKNYLDYYKEIVLETKTSEPTIVNNEPLNKTNTGALPGNENNCLSGTQYNKIAFVNMQTTYVSEYDLKTFIDTFPCDDILKTFYYGVIRTKLYNYPNGDGQVWSAPNYNFYNTSSGVKYHQDLVDTVSAQTCVTTALNNEQKPQPLFAFNTFVENLTFYNAIIKTDIGILNDLVIKSTFNDISQKYADAYSKYTLFKEQLRYVSAVAGAGRYATAPNNADEIIKRFNDKSSDIYLNNDYSRYFKIFENAIKTFSPF